MIVAVSFLGNALVDGLCSTFGVFLPYFLASFPGTSVGKTALAGSLMPCLFMTAGTPAFRLCQASASKQSQRCDNTSNIGLRKSDENK